MATKTRTVLTPKVLFDSLEAVGLSPDDIPRYGHIELISDLRMDRWWIRIDVFMRSEDGHRVGLIGGEAATETKVIPFLGSMKEL